MWNSFTYPNKIKTSGLNLLPGTISRCQNDLLDEGIVHILGKVGQSVKSFESAACTDGDLFISF